MQTPLPPSLSDGVAYHVALFDMLSWHQCHRVCMCVASDSLQTTALRQVCGTPISGQLRTCTPKTILGRSNSPIFSVWSAVADCWLAAWQSQLQRVLAGGIGLRGECAEGPDMTNRRGRLIHAGGQLHAPETVLGRFNSPLISVWSAVADCRHAAWQSQLQRVLAGGIWG